MSRDDTNAVLAVAALSILLIGMMFYGVLSYSVANNSKPECPITMQSSQGDNKC